MHSSTTPSTVRLLLPSPALLLAYGANNLVVAATYLQWSPAPGTDHYEVFRACTDGRYAVWKLDLARQIRKVEKPWLGGRDLNPDMLVQSQLSYR